MLGMLIAAMESTVVSTAMPSVIGDLHGIRLYPWVFSSYLLTSTTTVPIFGKLSDTFGRRPVYLVAL
ncbi:MAG TPA: MFS transporter, partial [Chthonomonadaceae bacterium]|nr:MFS transporter [Chthonomonadaceae bacterium]